MTTVTILIGNSDDKLTQKQWSDFWSRVDAMIGSVAEDVHFKGASYGAAQWQNACWVIVINEEEFRWLTRELKAVRTAFQQDSVAIVVGETKFV